MKKTVVVAQTLFLMLNFILSAYAQEIQVTAAVMEMEAKEGVSPGVVFMLSDYLRTQLVNTAKFTIVTRENMEQILKEQQFQMTGCTSQECLIQMGQLLGVRKIFTGTIGKIGSTYLINVKIIDVQSGQIEKAETEECAGCEEDSLLISLRNIASKIAGLSALEKVPQRIIKEEKTKKGYAVSFDTLLYQSSFTPPVQQKLRDAIGWYKACATWVPLGLIPYAYFVTPVGGLICGANGDGTLNETLKLSNVKTVEQLLEGSGFPGSAQFEIKEAIGWYKACEGWAVAGTVFEAMYWVGLVLQISSFQYNYAYYSYNSGLYVAGSILSGAGGWGMWIISPIGGWICGAQGDEHLKKALDAYNFNVSEDSNGSGFLPYFTLKVDQINLGFCQTF
ncbi:hypothetical protein COY52_02245 [Candidatus Desantisbacteria bacterium CG_4_10_14_0_8_um_filter_48_22]|uniref:FlgO domain-containing protein n=1 Tax=Candidatus Desantisbacteria bacterium CG_4_10_14_0_8_um_filter_48_22 TaxID=1974543 RepID=A0A2M7SF22_9BACT|nr:MAG: hypothetical protein AUJ67_01720 [Candidatus Desantisbacteria bacterium CG1_02_49_89]PIV56560.1 MAG: hypothetical protein COS16_03575 [Candidatus Desantisbacteria bacterium CG02_land_8_20_14_3_00_49_13]PIZ17903.1 MAG: hypothetical protein COY52_02245 [Candidatus Desantisbacteria bacterium CG_4_10_14_0_8_um_filter_48_22]